MQSDVQVPMEVQMPGSDVVATTESGASSPPPLRDLRR
jgi:hypothetical protein